MAMPRSVWLQFISALAGATLVSVGFFAYGAWRDRSLQFDYLLWNLCLAWLPLIFAVWLNRTLRHKLWSSWEALAASVLWLVFLPNGFYMISDFSHLHAVAEQGVLYDAVMFTSFIYIGVLLGFSSLYLIHLRLRQRLTEFEALSWIGLTLLLCSFAIYLGHDLRWNSWDVLTNPGGLLFDISDRLLHPAAYPDMILTVASFSVLLSSMYGLAWRGIRLLRVR